METASYQGRVERLAALMRAERIDALALADPANIYYLSGAYGFGTWRKTFVLVAADGKTVLIAPALEFEMLKAMSWISDVRQYVEFRHPSLPPDVLALLQPTLEELGVARGRIGTEREYLSAAFVERMAEALPKAHVVEGGQLPARLRMVKGPEELDLMRKAGQVGVAEVAAAVDALEDGKPEYEVTIAARAAGTRKAAEFIGPDDHYISPVINSAQIFAAGPERGTWAHAWASTRRMHRGELAEMCFCTLAHFYGYHLGFDRTVAIGGTPPPEHARLVDWGLQANNVGIAAVRPGVRASDVARAIDAMLESEGLLGYRTHRHGRGVGTGFSEAPDIKDLDDTVLEVGMTFSMEPGIYIPGLGGVRMGDSVAVTETGCEILTPAPYYWRGR